jgi:hypothetical protein
MSDDPREDFLSLSVHESLGLIIYSFVGTLIIVGFVYLLSEFIG